MSHRRGQQASAGGSDTGDSGEGDSHNTLECGLDNSDPVVSAVRFGMDSIMKIANETVPYCPEDEEELKLSIAENMEAAILQLVKTELTYAQTAAIMNGIVEDLNLHDNPEQETKEFMDAVDSISTLTNKRLADYKATLTEDILKSHPSYVTFKRELEALLDQADEENQEINNADAETEPEEVDLDDEGEQNRHEVIPDLDPISKQPLKDPCRNRQCQHIYGREAMLQLLKKNPRIRCPAMGCSNRQFVRPADLIDDPILTAKVTGQPVPTTSASLPAAPSSSTKRTPRKIAKGKSPAGRRRR